MISAQCMQNSYSFVSPTLGIELPMNEEYDEELEGSEENEMIEQMI